MKLTRKSRELLSFFNNNKYIDTPKVTNTTNNILLKIYQDILDAYLFLQTLKTNKNIYNVVIKKIDTYNEVTKPQNFNLKSFPPDIIKHINEMSFSEITYNFNILGRTCKIHFIVEETNVELKLKEYDKYIENIIMWFYILNLYSSKNCANSIVIYFYFTSLEKNLPNSKIYILDENHINTAFTTTCPKDSEIVIFRKEEWFKVFIHETFHNFGLDFSDMNNDNCHKNILSIFNVNSDVNAYEAYTEFWAEIINCCFCSFLLLKNKEDTGEFLNNSVILINFERKYSFFQLVKILDYMGLDYKNLYSTDSQSKTMRENLYKEKTNVLAYYVLKTILLNNYTDFLLWCDKNNLSLISFKKTFTNQNKFCEFIFKNYKKKNMLENINNAKLFLNNLYSSKKVTNNLKTFLLSNLRMTICELG